MSVSDLRFRKKGEREDISTTFSKPLANRTILISRTYEGNRVEREKLEQLGAHVLELSTIRIAPPSSWKKLDSAIRDLERFDWIVFTSANGVNQFFRRCARKARKRKFFDSLKTNKLSWPKFACVGPSTREALENLGFACSLEPKEYLTESLGRKLAMEITQDHNRVLLARAEKASTAISSILKRNGAKIYEAPAYRTVQVRRRVSSKMLDKVTDITLTSPSTVDGLLKSVTARMILARPIDIHCIGPVTARAAKAKGLKVGSVAKSHTIDGLIESLIGFESKPVKDSGLKN